VERGLLGTKRVLPGTKMGYSKGSPMRTAEEPFQVLDSDFFSKSVSCGWTQKNWWYIIHVSHAYYVTMRKGFDTFVLTLEVMVCCTTLAIPVW
jgi:hypothetical protein